MKSLALLFAALTIFLAGLDARGAFGDLDPAYSPFAGGGSAIATKEDGSAFVAGYTGTTLAVARLTPAGILDTSWGSGGRVLLPQSSSVDQLLIGKSGDLFVAMEGLNSNVDIPLSLVHLTARGGVDVAFGNNGAVNLGTYRPTGVGAMMSLALQADGKIVVLFGAYPLAMNQITIERFSTEGTFDASLGVMQAGNFGYGNALGPASYLVPGLDSILAWSVRGDGGIEVLVDHYDGSSWSAPKLVVLRDSGPVDTGARLIPQGIATWTSPLMGVDEAGRLLVARFHYGVARYGADGMIDAAFGNAGSYKASSIVTPLALWRQPGGEWTLVGTGDYQECRVLACMTPPDNKVRAVRFDDTGAPDASFGTPGLGDAGISFTGVVVHAPDGGVLYPDVSSVLHKYLGDAQRVEATVVEYYNPALDHYFITGGPGEVTLLDAHPELGWQRTGQSFGAWLAGDSGTSSVCRFYGDSVIGPDSHYYTSDAQECSALQQIEAMTPPGQPAWHYEGVAFDVTNPVGDACPPNLAPVYRAYNGVLGGVLGQAYRHTSDPAVYAQMLAKGWLAEGVRFCVPPRAN